MKRFLPVVPALAAGLALVAGPGRADIHLFAPVLLPGTLAQALARPIPRFTLPPGLTLPRVQPPSPSFGTRIPKTYLIYGLKTGPGGMACTDRNGQVMPLAFNPQITVGPYRPSLPTFSIQTLPPAFTLPRPRALPAPKKLPIK